MFRKYDPEKDRKACIRILNEVGWGEADHNNTLNEVERDSRCRVAEIDDEAECLVVTEVGDIDHFGQRLPFNAVLSVTTSHVARRSGVAGQLTAHSIAEDALDGALVTGLGIFDQGYYNKLGFGNGVMEHGYRFDPRNLRVPQLTRRPVRLGWEDVPRMHQARLKRIRRHGSLSIESDSVSRAEWKEHKDAFALGFENDRGELTHFFAMKGLGREHGPLSVRWSAWNTRDEFLELLGVLKSLSDQIDMVRMTEPPGIQLQDLLDEPFRDMRRTDRAPLSAGVSAMAYWQLRMNDIVGCLAKTRLQCDDIRFNLDLTDPIERYLPSDSPWRGTAGQFVVTLGRECHAERGVNASLPTMRASVNAFTRLWLGVRPATGLAYTDDLSASQELFEKLDIALRLPQPHIDWPI